MSRRLLSALIVACASVVLVACQSSGVHTQSYSPSPPDTPSTSPSTPSTRASAPKSSAPTPKSTATPIQTPTVVPAAQGAVNAYITLGNEVTAVSRNPKQANLAVINKHLTGKARTLFDNSIKSMASAGQAYRGTPANPRLKVQSIISPTSIVLSSCPLGSKTDPYVEYYVATGKPVPVRKHNPPTPYKAALFMTKVSGHWKLSDLVQDASKTCTG